ncbi:MAG: redox-sensing transcriptional repressor Rex [Thermoleophilia bacterium]|nr:redox-sensing transcriptional repressor Rex [Thermoleophilia bacterium]
MASGKLTLGLAARLSRYLQILTQTQKAGRDTISSVALSGYSGINPVQIRRDLSALGQLGKRGVGYDVETLIGNLRGVLSASGQHNIALLGAGNLGKAIAGSDIFSGHGFRVATVFDTDGHKVGLTVGDLEVRHLSEIPRIVPEKDIIAGMLAVPGEEAQSAYDALIGAGVRIVFNYSESLIDASPEAAVYQMSPVGKMLHAMYRFSCMKQDVHRRGRFLRSVADPGRTKDSGNSG